MPELSPVAQSTSSEFPWTGRTTARTQRFDERRIWPGVPKPRPSGLTLAASYRRLCDEKSLAKDTATVRSSRIDDGHDLAELLLPWNLTSPSFIEIVHRRRASRTWWVDADKGRFVAKLTFDRRCFVEPGLKVAAEVAKGGIATGPPVPTERGELWVEVDRGTSRPWTLALLTPVLGEPLSPSAPGAEAIAGDLLGRVHSFLGESSRRD